MAIAFRSATEAGTGSVQTSLTINVPSGVQNDDILLLFGVTADGDDGGFDALTGWTEIIDAAVLNTGGSAPSPPGMSVWYRLANSEPASYTITPTFGSTGIAAQMQAFSGGNVTTQIDVTTTTATGDGSNADPPSITTVTDGAITSVAAFWDATGTTATAPSGYTSSGGLGVIVGSGGGNGCVLASAYRNSVIDPSAAENPAAFTSSSEQWGAVTVALRPAPSEGITDVSPADFDMDEASITITGLNFSASGNTIYISDADTLAGSVNEVDISSAINTESTTSINLDLTQLSAAELASLHTLGPNATRYIIVYTVATDEYGSDAVRMRRPEAFKTSLGLGTPGATTARLTAPATKTTGDFDAGRFEEAANPATAVDITANDYTEMVWSIEAKTLSREVSYDFRITKNGNVVDTYTVTPQVTISAVTDITDEIASATFTLTAATTGSLYNHVTPIATASFAITPSSVGSFQNRKTQVDSASFAITTAEISSYAERTTAIDSATYSITPSDIGSLYNRITQIASAAFTLTPSDVGSLAQKTTAIDSATYTLTAGDIGSLYNPRTAIDSAAYVITAADITSTYNALAETTSAESASFILTPGNVSSLYNRLTSIDSATYQIVTADITSTYIAGIETTFAESASFVITPGEVGSFHNRTTEVESATFSLTTGDIGSFKHHVIDVDSAAFNLTTSVISSLYNRVTPIETAVFTITTGDVSSDYIIPLTGTTTYYTGRQMLITLDDTAFPLEIAVDNTGGVTGLTITASIRDPADSASYLDFNDSTFKPSGWTTKAQSLTEYGSGFYGVSLDVSAITNMPTGKHLSVEYDITGTVTGVRAEMLTVNQEVMDINTRTEFYTKTLKNRRKVIKDGSSWYLEVYDDDDAAVIMKKLLHDHGNNDIYDLESGILAEEHKSSV